jgi:hypothetical protein
MLTETTLTFAERLALLQPALHRLAVRLVGVQNAESLAQATNLRALDRQWQCAGEPWPWVRRIMFRLRADMYRRRARRREVPFAAYVERQGPSRRFDADDLLRLLEEDGEELLARFVRAAIAVGCGEDGELDKEAWAQAMGFSTPRSVDAYRCRLRAWFARRRNGEQTLDHCPAQIGGGFALGRFPAYGK